MAEPLCTPRLPELIVLLFGRLAPPNWFSPVSQTHHPSSLPCHSHSHLSLLTGARNIPPLPGSPLWMHQLYVSGSLDPFKPSLPFSYVLPPSQATDLIPRKPGQLDHLGALSRFREKTL